jgi:hypothetical protein
MKLKRLYVPLLLLHGLSSLKCGGNMAFLSNNISCMMQIPKKPEFKIPKKKIDAMVIPPLLKYDATNFVRVHPEFNTAEEYALAFMDRWMGYKKDYTQVFIVGVFRQILGIPGK